MNNLSQLETDQILTEVLPRVLTGSWTLGYRNMDGAAYCDAWNKAVIISVARELDGKRWIHLSMSHKNRVPYWDELKDAKFIFLGDRKAIQVFPSKAEWVDICPYALHLFSCLDEDKLPDFSRGSGSL